MFGSIGNLVIQFFKGLGSNHTNKELNCARLTCPPLGGCHSATLTSSIYDEGNFFEGTEPILPRGNDVLIGSVSPNSLTSIFNTDDSFRYSVFQNEPTCDSLLVKSSFVTEENTEINDLNLRHCGDIFNNCEPNNPITADICQDNAIIQNDSVYDEYFHSSLLPSKPTDVDFEPNIFLNSPIYPRQILSKSSTLKRCLSADTLIESTLKSSPFDSITKFNNLTLCSDRRHSNSSLYDTIIRRNSKTHEQPLLDFTKTPRTDYIPDKSSITVKQSSSTINELHQTGTWISVHFNLKRPLKIPFDFCDTFSHSGLPDSFPFLSKNFGKTDELSIFNTTYFLPSNIVKSICITRDHTAQNIIDLIVEKLYIDQNDRSHYQLYQKIVNVYGKIALRQISPIEYLTPLIYQNGALISADFVIKDHIEPEIIWDQFTLPELNTFLSIINHEEAAQLTTIVRKYERRKQLLQRRLHQLCH